MGYLDNIPEGARNEYMRQYDNDEDEAEFLVEENLETLQEYFTDMLEYGGIPITKDNCEDLFDSWLGDLSLLEIRDILKED